MVLLFWKVHHFLDLVQDERVQGLGQGQCGGHCKMVHSMRSTPPSLHTEALRKFDEEVRSTFCAITGLMPDPASWNQACRGTAHAGLGLRQSALHAPAAYIAPTAASRALSVARCCLFAGTGRELFAMAFGPCSNQRRAGGRRANTSGKRIDPQSETDLGENRRRGPCDEAFQRLCR